VTTEVDAALRSANEVLFVDTGLATPAFLAARCPRITPLFEDSYAESGARLSSYHHMAARTLASALDHPPVVFAMHGHPTVFSYPAFLVRELATELGLEVRVLPGISAHDTVLAALWIDPSVRGLLQYEATDLLLRRRALLPDVPTLIWQIGLVESRLYSKARSRPERFHALRDYLLQSYPQGHRAIAIYTSPHPRVPPTRFEFAIEEMPSHAEHLHAGFTLYLPPAVERPIADADLLARLDDPAHLARVTFSSE
jgi:hypothetical protein